MNDSYQLEQRKEEAAWLRNLRDLAQQWVRDRDGLVRWYEDHGQLKRTDDLIPTDAYVDLIFAFGLARLGVGAECRDLLGRARASLTAGGDAIHNFLFKAYEWRITEGLAGRPHPGPLAPALQEELSNLPVLPRYGVDRFQKESRILEPDQRIDPYRRWAARISDLDGALAELAGLQGREEVAARVERLLNEPPQGMSGDAPRSRILSAALEVAPRVGDQFAREMLGHALQAHDTLPETDEWSRCIRADLLEKAFVVVAHFGLAEHLRPLIDRFQMMLRTGGGLRATHAIDPATSQCFCTLRRLGMRDEMDLLLTQTTASVLGGRDLGSRVESIDPKVEGPAPLAVLLTVAANWLSIGRVDRAIPIVEAVWAVLLEAKFKPLIQMQLACKYATAVGRLPTTEARRRFEGVFRELPGVQDTFTTQTHFSVALLTVIEAVILAVVDRWQPLTQR